MNNIALNIEAVRKKVGIKQEILAEMSGVTQGTDSGYLTQNQDIKYRNFIPKFFVESNNLYIAK